MPKKPAPLEENDIRKVLALRMLHERLDDLLAEDPNSPLTLGMKCAVDCMHYALEKSAKDRCLDMDQVAEILGGGQK